MFSSHQQNIFGDGASDQEDSWSSESDVSENDSSDTESVDSLEEI
jgi:hypothetical protein